MAIDEMRFMPVNLQEVDDQRSNLGKHHRRGQACVHDYRRFQFLRHRAQDARCLGLIRLLTRLRQDHVLENFDGFRQALDLEPPDEDRGFLVVPLTNVNERRASTRMLRIALSMGSRLSP